MAALNRPQFATKVVHESIQVDTQGKVRVFVLVLEDEEWPFVLS